MTERRAPLLLRAVIAAPMLLLLARLTAPRTRPFVARDYAAFAAALLLGDRLRPLNWAGIVLSVAAVLLTIAKGSVHVLATSSSCCHR